MKLDVPYFRQETAYTCGPACLRMVLAFYGQPLTEVELERRCRTTPFGTPRAQIWLAARQLGYNADLPRLRSFQEVEMLVASQRPVIAVVDARLLRQGGGQTHGVVITGTDGASVLFHDPDWQADVRMDWNDFWTAWERRHGKGVVVWRP